MRSTHGFGLVLFTCLSACTASVDGGSRPEPKNSSAFPLEKLNASYGAFSDGKSMDIFVAVLADGFLLMRDGDNVTADVNGTAVPLTERIEDGKVHYVGNLVSPPSEPNVTITFTRGADKVAGKVRMGPNFEPKSPPTSAKLGDVVPIDLDPRPDLSTWQSFVGPLLHHAIEVHGECIDEEKQKKIEVCTKDSPQGTCKIEYPLQWDTSKVIFKDGATGCEVDAQIRLESPAPTWEGAFKGSFEGSQNRRFKVTLTK